MLRLKIGNYMLGHLTASTEGNLEVDQAAMDLARKDFADRKAAKAKGKGKGRGTFSASLRLSTYSHLFQQQLEKGEGPDRGEAKGKGKADVHTVCRCCL